ncbi:hypothetical protein KC367_g8247 [Hortaea werneckii]|nr:hypothetical protein KC367_g8247 [Hortaea werneckii]
MDSAGYLKRHGWRGAGHSLDKTDRGIKKPLLVSKKVDVLGVGLNKHAAVSDQWWLRAFDQGLKDFGTGKESTLANVQKHGVNRGGLYGRFVKGEGMKGTIGTDEPKTVDDMSSNGDVAALPKTPTGKVEGVQAAANGSEKKRKRESKADEHSTKRKRSSVDDGDKKKGDKYERQKTKREAKSAGKESNGETKEQRRARKEKRRAEKEDMSAAKNARRDKKAERKTLRKAEKSSNDGHAQPRGSTIDELANGADEVKLKSAKSIPNADAVDKYPSKAQKKAKKMDRLAAEHGGSLSEQDKLDLYNASKRGLSLEQYRSKVAIGALKAPGAEKKKEPSSQKLEEYKKRAQEKGVSLEEYMRRRDEKNAAKQLQDDNSLPIVIDTPNGTPGTLTLRASEPDYSLRACQAIERDMAFVLLDEAGEKNLSWRPGEAVPVDESSHPITFTGDDRSTDHFAEFDRSTMAENEMWALITGVSRGGLGDALTTELLERNINVIATNIRMEDMDYLSSTPSPTQDTRLEKLQLDVTDPVFIATARDATAKLTGGKLDFLFNNAGYGYMMPLLDCSIEDMRKNFDVNVFGLLAVTQALFPLLREAGGVVVNQSSIAALSATYQPFIGSYQASKSALSSLSNNMRVEFAPFGVKVVTLETGDVRTGFWTFASANGATLPPVSLYHPIKDVAEKTMRGQGNPPGQHTRENWAKAVIDDLLQSRPPSHVRRGYLATTLYVVSLLMPFWVLDWLYTRACGLDKLRELVKQHPSTHGKKDQ